MRRQSVPIPTEEELRDDDAALLGRGPLRQLDEKRRVVAQRAAAAPTPGVHTLGPHTKIGMSRLVRLR